MCVSICLQWSTQFQPSHQLGSEPRVCCCCMYVCVVGFYIRTEKKQEASEEKVVKTGALVVEGVEQTETHSGSQSSMEGI